jgi:hypothetical protein
MTHASVLFRDLCRSPTRLLECLAAKRSMTLLMGSQCVISLALVLITAVVARGDDRYYVMIFGAQEERPRPKTSHSFATFVKVHCDQPENALTIVGTHTISWLPSTMVVRNACLPEAGTNFDLYTTIGWALDNCTRVSMWGPYEICEDLYCRALEQIDLLESGQVRYKAVDTGYKSNRVSNCIHAVSSLAGGYRLRVVSPEWGDTASWYLTRRLDRWYINPEEKHLWISSALGLDQYPIVYREFENPRSSLLWSFIRPGP